MCIELFFVTQRVEVGLDGEGHDGRRIVCQVRLQGLFVDSHAARRNSGSEGSRVCFGIVEDVVCFVLLKGRLPVSLCSSHGKCVCGAGTQPQSLDEAI